MFRSFGTPSERFTMMIQPATTIQATTSNSGIVPPWLQGERTKNPGIVPPWLLEPIHILPVDDEPEFHILPVGGDTQFVTESVDVSPTSLADALRAR